MRLSRTIAYAVAATLELARAEPNCPISCSDLASRGKMPKRFLLQILRVLVRYDVLCSVRGVGGGYYLARAPNDITLLDIFEAFEITPRPTVPELPRISGHTRERLMASLAKTSEAWRQELKKLTLADLVHLPRDGLISPTE